MLRLLSVLALVLGASPTEKPVRVVRVAAAADLTFAMADLKAALAREHPDVVLEVTLGSSGALHTQVQHRGPFDVFLSANDVLVADLVKQQHASAQDVFVYATGRLALWYPPHVPAAVRSKGLEGLRDSAIRRLALANPRHAPYGRAATEVLEALGLATAYEKRLVLGDNVAATAALARTGNVDAALLALPVTLVAAMDSGTRVDVPAHLHRPLVQTGVVLTRARDAAAAREFAVFMRSPQARAVLASHGFGPPAGE